MRCILEELARNAHVPDLAHLIRVPANASGRRYRSNRKMRIAGFVCLSIVTPAVFSQQQPVDPTNMYERLFVVVRMVGKGTLVDPRRSMYAPVPTTVNPTLRSGILGYSQVVSDDGNFALVEFVAKDRAAFMGSPAILVRSVSACCYVFQPRTRKSLRLHCRY